MSKDDVGSCPCIEGIWTFFYSPVWVLIYECLNQCQFQWIGFSRVFFMGNRGIYHQICMFPAKKCLQPSTNSLTSANGDSNWSIAFQVLQVPNCSILTVLATRLGSVDAVTTERMWHDVTDRRVTNDWMMSCSEKTRRWKITVRAVSAIVISVL